MNESVSLVLPQNVNLTQDVGPYSQKQNEIERTQQKQVSAVAFLNKLEQEAILRAQEPVLEKLQKEHASITKKLDRAAAKLVGALKVEDAAKEVKAALLAWGMTTVKLGATLDKINYDERVLEVSKTCGGTDYEKLNAEEDVPFTPEMVTLVEKREKLDDQIRDVSNVMVEAQAKLKNRANLLADAQGALALKTMSKDEVEQVKDMYDTVKSGITVEKLLGAGKKD